MSPVSAADDATPDVPYATVTGHAPQSSIANQPSYWCEDGWKLEGSALQGGLSADGRTYVLPTGTFSRVIVKAGAGSYANTIFGDNPTTGQVVWADTNKSFTFDSADRAISHIIVCPGPDVPEKTTLTVTKVWAGTNTPDGYVDSLTSADAGDPAVTVDGEPILEPAPEWGSAITDLPVDADAQVSEGEVPPLPQPEGFRCEITGPPAYAVNGGAFGGSASFPLKPGGNTVQVRNTVDCVEVEEPPAASLKVLKQWVPGDGVPTGYPTLDSGDAGTLTVLVNDKPTGQSWNDLQADLPVGGSAVVTETKPTLAPFAGYECTVSDPTYVVNGGSTQDSAEFRLLEGSNTVTVVNSFDCSALVIPPPPTTSITVTKSWVYVGAPLGYSATTPGPLTVTVGGAATSQAWGATTSGHAVGATATVAEGAVPTPPQPTDLECVAGTPTYAVNGGTPTTTAPSFALAAAPNTVTVTNTVTCTPVAVDEVEEEAEVGGEEAEDGAVAGSESELADTGADLTGGLGAILVLAGAALIAARRIATQ